jgi:hypothetical protein
MVAMRAPTHLHQVIGPAQETRAVGRRRKATMLRSLLARPYSEGPLEVCSSHVLSRRILTQTAFAGHEIGHGGLSTLLGAAAGGKSSQKQQPFIAHCCQHTAATKSRSDERRRKKRSIVAKARVASWTANTVANPTSTTTDATAMTDVAAIRGGRGVDGTAAAIARVMVGDGGDRIMEVDIRAVESMDERINALRLVDF